MVERSITREEVAIALRTPDYECSYGYLAERKSYKRFEGGKITAVFDLNPRDRILTVVSVFLD